MDSERETPTPAEQVARLYEQAEAQAAKASESFVSSQGFGWMLGRTAENVAALTRLGADAMDVVLRNLRLAGRRDIVRLARQLARNEDKLERVLQEVEALRDELKRTGEGRGLRAHRGAGNGRAEGPDSARESETPAGESEDLGHA
jgi:hypothetical protein